MPLLKILQWFPAYPRIKSNLPESPLPRSHHHLASPTPRSSGLPGHRRAWSPPGTLDVLIFRLSCSISSLTSQLKRQLPNAACLPDCSFLSALSNHIPLLHVMEQISIHSGDLLPDLTVYLCPFWNASLPQGLGGVSLVSSSFSVV